MDTKSQQKLDEIVRKEPAALTEGDKAFLRARKSYLTAEQVSTFADELGEGKRSSKKKDDEE